MQTLRIDKKTRLLVLTGAGVQGRSGEVLPNLVTID
jgi:hypothetical protein